MLKVVEVHPSLAAEIKGVDLSKTVDEETLRGIEEAWHRHGVVFFRDQDLTPEQHIAFSRRFGALETHVRTNVAKPGYPEILVVSNIIENGKPIGSQDAGLFWHSDLCYKDVPSRGSLLYSREVPVRDGSALGDTQFVSTSVAYETLSEDLKKRLHGLRAINSYIKAYNRERASKRPPLTEAQLKAVPDVVHPIVRTHPFTGRKCLFVNEGYTSVVLDVPADESEAMLRQLCAHITRPEAVYRHKWRVGDLLMWDNCSTQHCAISDYKLPERRLMERTTLQGSVPY